LAESLSGGGSLVGAVQSANAAVHLEAQDQAMGTTLVAALLDGTRAEIAHVGDSRAYHLDPLGLVQITRDHTMGREAAEAGALEESRAAPDRWTGALARFLGAEDLVEVEHHGILELHEGDWLLLCTDGLHRVLSTSDLEDSLTGETDPAEASQRLVETALERNSEDNVSVALVHRPGKERSPMASSPPPRRENHWDPEALLERSPRTTMRRRRMRLWTIITLVVIPVVIILGLSLIWAWSPGTP
jgi:serine/threonine protein phosphatase PrpC